MMFFNTIKLLGRSLTLKFFGEDAQYANDYNIAAATYDDYYSRYLGKSSLELMMHLPLKPGMKIIDLACGTGFFSQRIAPQLGPQGKLIAVDLSSRMLEKNREHAKQAVLSNIEFLEADALLFLQQQDNASVDGAVCDWGICYMDHAALRKELERVVRPGGFLGTIENRACTLADVSGLFQNVLIQHPTAIVKNVAIDLPKDYRYLLKAFTGKAFKSVYALDSSVVIPCANGQEIADYILKSGGAAGFIDALDKKKIDMVMEAFVREADRRLAAGKPISVRYEWSMLVAERL